MNEDYLWDKTGRDPEIEELENALGQFGYRETSPPELPAKVVSFTRKPSLWSFRYAMTAAACLAFFAVSFGIWLQFSTRDRGPDKVSGAAADQPGNIELTPGLINGPLTKAEESARPPEKSRSIKAGRSALPAAHKNIAAAQNSRASKPAVKLTKEEEYAYDQLKLALSITGSKLKLIKDKVDSVEDKNVVLKKGR